MASEQKKIRNGIDDIDIDQVPGRAIEPRTIFAPVGPAASNFAPPGHHPRQWTAAGGFVTHMAHVEAFPGPYPFIAAPDYPGKA